MPIPTPLATSVRPGTPVAQLDTSTEVSQPLVRSELCLSEIDSAVRELMVLDEVNSAVERAEIKLPRVRLHKNVRHFVAWWGVGLGMGLLTASSWQPVPIIAFAIAGLVIGTVLACVTFPLAKQSRLIVLGACAGLVVYLLRSLFVVGGTAPQSASLCWLIGGLIGATVTVWQLPLVTFSYLVKRMIFACNRKLGTIYSEQR